MVTVILAVHGVPGEDAISAHIGTSAARPSGAADRQRNVPDAIAGPLTWAISCPNDDVLGELRAPVFPRGFLILTPR
jgi:hypothetical protein